MDLSTAVFVTLIYVLPTLYVMLMITICCFTSTGGNPKEHAGAR